MTKEEAVAAGLQDAKGKSTVGWFLGGFLFSIIAIPAAHISRPTIPVGLLASFEDETTRDLYQRAFEEHVKDRRVVAVWTGLLVLVGLFMLLVGEVFL